MSYDLKAQVLCDHKVVEDIAFLNSDRVTVQIQRFLAVTKSLQVKRDGWVIPQNSAEFGWQLTNDPTSTQGLKQIVMNKPQKSLDDFFELTYTTTSPWCPKCNGLNVYWDFAVDNLGQLVLINVEPKLIQDVIKGTFTIRGSNQFYPWYGTLFDALIGAKIVNFDNTKLIISQDVNQFFANLKDLQAQQAQIQEVDPQEALDSLVSLNVTQPSATLEPPYINVSIIFRNKAGNLQQIREVIDSRSQQVVYGDVRDKLLLQSSS